MHVVAVEAEAVVEAVVEAAEVVVAVEAEAVDLWAVRGVVAVVADELVEHVAVVNDQDSDQDNDQDKGLVVVTVQGMVAIGQDMVVIDRVMDMEGIMMDITAGMDMVATAMVMDIGTVPVSGFLH